MHNKHIQRNSTRIDISVVINRQRCKRPVSNGVEFELSELWMPCVGWSIWSMSADTNGSVSTLQLTMTPNTERWSNVTPLPLICLISWIMIIIELPFWVSFYIHVLQYWWNIVTPSLLSFWLISCISNLRYWFKKEPKILYSSSIEL